MQKLTVKTKHKTEMADITSEIKESVIKSGIKNGLITIFTPHTTASVIVFENQDPGLLRDMLKTLSRLIPTDGEYSHTDNAHAHIKSGICGASVTLIIENGKLVLGKWQGVFLTDFDGPREREVYLKAFICE